MQGGEGFFKKLVLGHTATPPIKCFSAWPWRGRAGYVPFPPARSAARRSPFVGSPRNSTAAPAGGSACPATSPRQTAPGIGAARTPACSRSRRCPPPCATGRGARSCSG